MGVKSTMESVDVLALLHLVPEILFVLEKTPEKGWVISFITPSVKRLGFTPASLRQKPFISLFSKESQKVLDQTLRAFKGREMKLGLRVHLKRRDGKTVPATLGMALVATATPRAYGVLTLLSQLSVVDRILNQIDVGVLLVDQRLRARYANRYVRRLFSSNGLPVQLPDYLKQVIQEYIKEKDSRENLEIHTPDGRVLGLSLYPLKSTRNGRRPEWVMILKDITEKKMIQETLVRLDRFSSFGILASGLAHEIKNPLAGMRLIAQNLMRSLEGKPRDSVERMIRQIDRIDHLIKQFFSFVKPKVQQLRDVSLPQVWEELLPLVQERVTKNKVELRVSLDPSHVIRVDVNHIQQILLNLVLNALDAMPRGGTLTLRSEQVQRQFPDRPEQEWIRIVVEDTGYGMDPEQLDKIFVPFFTTKSSGTGLGLYIVHQLVQENKGYIFVESEKGKGTRFELLFPRSKGGD